MDRPRDANPADALVDSVHAAQERRLAASGRADQCRDNSFLDVEIDVEEGLRSKAVSEAIYESGKAGQLVRVADVLSGKVNAWQRDVDRMWKL